MTFEQALEAVKEGKKVARKGWNGKGMFIFMTPESYVPFSKLKDHNQRHLIAIPESRVKINAHIDMKAADDSLLIGWVPSQLDMLSDDWEIVI